MWLVSIPVWGAENISKFNRATLPTILAAAAQSDLEFKYLVYTDGKINLDAVFRELPASGPQSLVLDNLKYKIMSGCHKDTIAQAQDGDYVALLTADMALSREVFTACEQRFRDGYSAVVAAATRTLSIAPPKPDLPAAELIEWTLNHLHPLVKSCFYGASGNCPWAVYFQNGRDVTVRGFHLHPVAIKKTKPITYEGSLDEDLLENFEFSEIHVVTEDELALAEMSPSMKFHLNEDFITDPINIARWGSEYATAVHWWLASHRIILRGDGNTDDEAVWQQVLANRTTIREKWNRAL